MTDGKGPLSGVTVNVTSPNLQATRTATSAVNGDYVLDSLPSGLSAVKFDLQGRLTVDTAVKISGDETSRMDAVMPHVTRVAEEVAVSRRYDTISTTSTGAATYESKLIEALPVSRDVSGYVNLTPGTVQISGAAW